MIWHFFEVWSLLLAAFIVGCGLGAALYAGIGNSALATAQGSLADSIGDLLDGVKARLGLGPDWRDGFRVRVPIERPAPRRRARQRDDEVFDETEYESSEIASLSRAVADRARDRDHDGDWDDEDDYRGRGEGPRDYVDDDEADAVYAHEPPPANPVSPSLAGDLVAASETVAPKRPAGLLAPRNGVPDHLQRIRGIGKGNEELLNSFGIFHFGQIAAWTPAEARWVAEQMPFPERIERDDWIGQAVVLASGGDTGYVKSAEKRRARRAAGEGGEEGKDAGDAD
jgi:predicted flap endonuclease-1-like 5' DNA nuclease